MSWFDEEQINYDDDLIEIRDEEDDVVYRGQYDGYFDDEFSGDLEEFFEWNSDEKIYVGSEGYEGWTVRKI